MNDSLLVQAYRLGIRFVLLAIFLSCFVAPIQAQPDLNAAFLKIEANWSKIIFDCVTGDNPSGIPGSSTGKEPDATGGTDNLVCDDWEVDRYERPLTSSAQNYSAWQDLVEARGHSTQDWWYFWIEIFEANQGVMQGFFLIEMDTGVFSFAGGADCSDWLLWNNNPTSNIVGTDGYDAWSQKGMDSFTDTDSSGPNNVGGQNAVCQRADFLDGQNSTGGDGFETQGPKEGDGDIYGMVPAGESDKVVIIAMRKSALSYPGAIPNSVEWRAWTNEQSQAPNYYQPNDEYDRTALPATDQVGSPYVASAFFPVKGNIKELDNTPFATVVFVDLPVELKNFTAVVEDVDIVLNWATSSERDNAGFEIEQSIEDGSFVSLGYVEGNGTTEEEKSYQFKVANAEFGRQVFRLKQIDFDGTFAYSEQVEVTKELASGYLLKRAFPNPFNPQTSFSLLIDSEQQVDVGVYNMTGQRVATIFNGVLTGQEWHQMTFEAGGLSSGSYLIRSVGDGFRNTQTVVLMK